MQTKEYENVSHFFIGSIVVSMLSKWFEYQRVGGTRLGFSLHIFIVSLDKKIHSMLSLFTQVYKWVPVTN